MTNFNTNLNTLAPTIISMKDKILSEEGTKTAMIMPVLQLLGYNVFDPTEVRPEMSHDTPGKKRERVDFGISIDGTPVMLVEAKKVGSRLDARGINQLFRYFTESTARVGVLTDGLKYLFFSDVDQDNKMDQEEFFRFDFENFTDEDVAQLEMFTKEKFNVDNIGTTALDLRYISSIHERLMSELESPSDEFVKLLSTDVGDGRFMGRRRNHLIRLAQTVTKNFVTTEVNNKLQALVIANDPAYADQAANDSEIEEDVILTAEEMTAYHLIQAICVGVVAGNDIKVEKPSTKCNFMVGDKRLAALCFNEGNISLKIGDDKVQIGLSSIAELMQYQDQIIGSLNKAA